MTPITYHAGSDCSIASGHTLTGGIPTEVKGVKVVLFKTVIQGRPMALRYDTRPDLARLVDEYLTAKKTEQEAREKAWAEERAKRDAVDAPLIAQMQAQAEELRKQIPANCLPVLCEQTGDLDGWPVYKYTVNGIEVPWDRIKVLGRPSAVRPGAMGSFAEVTVAYTTPEQFEAVQAERVKQVTERSTPPESHSETRPCKYCGTYCYGDCGGKPGDETQEDRVRRTAISEESFGIMEG